jgi:hypothetical protein
MAGAFFILGVSFVDGDFDVPVVIVEVVDGFFGKHGDVDVGAAYFEGVAPKRGGILIEAVAAADVVYPAVSRTDHLIAFELAVGEIEVVVFAADLGRPEGSVGVFDDGDGFGDEGIGFYAGAREVVHRCQLYKLG